MPAMFKSAAVALAFAGLACAQSSSVISVFLPDTDQQTLVGSLVASDSSKTTIAFGCPSGEDSDDCGFGSGLITATFGSSTLVYTQTVDSLTLGLDCAVTGTTAATCTQTYVGPAGFIEELTATDDSQTATDTAFNAQVTTSVTSTVLGQSDITFMPITLTAFANAEGSPSGSASGTAPASQGTQATATSTGSGAAATATHTGAAMAMDSLHETWAFAGAAGLVGLAAMVL